MARHAQSQVAKYILRLYVAGDTPQSVLALRNLKSLCEEHLASRYQIEVIDLSKHPELAKADQILAVPTLVRELPSPVRKFIGNLAQSERVLVEFDLLSHQGDPPTSGEGEKHV